MKRVLILLSTAGLAACNSQQAQVAAPVPNGSSWLEISDRLVHDWNKCVTSSYQQALEHLSDKNAAAETAFAACRTEEDEEVELSSEHVIPMGGWLHYKSQAKVVLIERGTLLT